MGLTGKGSIIGVMDTGIDASHPEFAGKTIHFAAFDEAGAMLSDTSPRDYEQHGTHVCGVIAGASCGVAPGATLAVAAVLTKRNAANKMAGQLAQVLAGLNWLVQTRFAQGHVSVINGSLSSGAYDRFCYDPLLDARNLQGILFVAAIGNQGPLPDRHGSPGNYDCAVGVGAVDENDVVASFSDYGVVVQHPQRPKPDLCAPGVQISSCIPGGDYATMTGTMASPVVAGACGLLLEADPTLVGNGVRLESEVLTRAFRSPASSCRRVAAA